MTRSAAQIRTILASARAGEHPHVTRRDLTDHLGGGRGIESDVLLAIAKHHGPFLGLTHDVGRVQQQGTQPLGDQDLATQPADRHVQPDHRRQGAAAEPGGDHQLRRGEVLAATAHGKGVGAWFDRCDRAAWEVCSTFANHSAV
jgi:hypothetical protein